MRVAVLGCGSIGQRHLSNLVALGCELVTAVDTREAALARLPDGVASFYLGPDSGFAASDYDALVIATPHDQHLSWVQFAMDSGVPFFTEKPLGSLAQLPQWRALAARSDLPINQVGYNWRFHAQLLEWKARLDRAGDGTGRTVSIECATDIALWPGHAYGDPLLETSHELDTALWLGASPHVLHANYLLDEPGCDIVLEGYRVRSFWARAKATRTYHVYQPCRQLRETKICSCPTHEHMPLRVDVPSVMLDLSYRRELEHFLTCVRDQTPTICPLADGLRVLGVCAQVEALTKQTAEKT